MKHTVLLFSCVLIHLCGFAQNADKSDIQTLKIAFITQALDLNSKEAQAFWPVYNKYESQGDELQEQMHCSVYDQMDKLESMTPEESDALLKNYMTIRNEEQKLREEYVAELKKVISPKEIMLLKRAEYDFHMKLLKEYRSGKSEK